MELFTLGADRGLHRERTCASRRGRSPAGATTGRRRRRRQLPLDPKYHDAGVKTVFGKSGDFDWRDVVPAVPRRTRSTRRSSSRSSGATSSRRAPPRATQQALERIYVAKLRDPAGVEAILLHPAALHGPADGEAARRVRRRACSARSGAGSTPTSWFRIGPLSGQRLFYPPNVAGWDETRWLDTATSAVAGSRRGARLPRRRLRRTYAADAGQALSRSDRVLGQPDADQGDARRLLAFAQRTPRRPGEQTLRTLRQNALRQLVATSPDLQTA